MYANSLSEIHSALSSKMSDVNEKINRLEQAKRQIKEEQNACLGEIAKIKNPYLAKSWTGKRAEDFQDARSDAYKAMSTIIHDDYDDYQEKIDGKIMMLNIEKKALSAAGTIAHEADVLLGKGEAFIDQLESKISYLKGWLF
ncbi:YwqH-like family protein [Peribacillus phoenicis]|uniref:YwqH-like family protein n=1 Tax=unclassified Peribacillus TaxID=2675266 RepID=UPI0039A291A8